MNGRISLLFLWGLVSAASMGCEMKMSIEDEIFLETKLSGSQPSLYVNSATYEILATFNKDIQSVRESGVRLHNADLVGIRRIRGNLYGITVAPESLGTVRIELPPGTFVDDGGTTFVQTHRYEFIFDDEPPVISVTAPAPGSLQGPAVSLTGTCEAGIGPVVISGSGLVTSGTAACLAGVFTVSVVMSAPDGLKDIEISQRDRAGNEMSVSHQLELDSTGPSVVNLLSAYGSIQDNAVAVRLDSCVDLNEASGPVFEMLIQEGTALPSATDPRWVSCSTSPVSLSLSGDGDHVLYAWLRDERGNRTLSNPVTIKLDTVTPTIQVPASATLSRNDPATVIGAAEDVTASEEGNGIYSVAAATAPDCADYGTVSVDPASGEVTYEPAPDFYTGFVGGVCHVGLRFSDLVTPTPHEVTAEIAVTVNWVNQPPDLASWPGNNGSQVEDCGDKCYTPATYELSFTAPPGGGSFPDDDTLTCSATSSDGFYVVVDDCSITGTAGKITLIMDSAHPSPSDTTTITLTVSDGEYTVTRTFLVHVENYVVNMYPALVVRSPVSCILCHANIQADLVTDFAKNPGDDATPFFLGLAPLNESHIYDDPNLSVPFTINGSVYTPKFQVTDPNFIKQVRGSLADTSPIDFVQFLMNDFNLYPVVRAANGAVLTDPDGTVQVSSTPSPRIAAFPASAVTPQPGNERVIGRDSMRIRAPASSEILALAPALTAGTPGFTYKGPTTKPAFSGLAIEDVGQGPYVRNSGTVVCHGSIFISGPVYLKDLDLQTDDVGCSIYVAGNVFIESSRAEAIQYVGGASTPTLQLSASGAVYMGINLYEAWTSRPSGVPGHLNEMRRIVNLARPAAMRDAAEGAVTIKSNGIAGSHEYMKCPLRPEHANYLDQHYVSDGNYTACNSTTENCGWADVIFNNHRGAVTAYDHLNTTPFIYNGSTLVNMVQAYETMCRRNGAFTMANYSSYGWSWQGQWGQSPSAVGAAEINPLRFSTTFSHFRVNAAEVQSRYSGVFNGSVIAPYALFAVGNLVFYYDSRLNNVVPFPRLMSPTPIFSISDN